MSRSLLAVVAMGSKQTQPLIPGRFQRLRSPVLQVEHLDCGECSAKSKSRRARRFRRVLYLSLLHGHEKPMMPRESRASRKTLLLGFGRRMMELPLSGLKDAIKATTLSVASVRR